MKTCSTAGTSARRRGFSLVEVMVAMLILTILIAGGAAFMTQSGETIAFQRDKRAAIEAANRHMEWVRSVPYSAFDGVGSDFVYLSPAGSAFAQSSSDPGNTVLINGRDMPVSIRGRHVELTGGRYSDSECLEIEVRVVCRPGTGDDVVLKSYHAKSSEERE